MGQDNKLTRRQLAAAAITGVVLAATSKCEERRGSTSPEETPDSGQTTQERPSN
ncbi:hypothetical protein SAMN06265355_11544 [Actinomadura mexicana]|uniref:Uncharacterized protein n=1 Tax=Actinomadura mexicana TaxID=134959 RepID=A0A239DKZ0_9ACTN|nr:hypothetical protein SAMN06265355_11544 [Actinomadura mexicana]